MSDRGGDAEKQPWRGKEYVLDLSNGKKPDWWLIFKTVGNMFVVSLLLLGYYWLCDFVYLGRDSTDLFGFQKGILCRLEFENVVRHYSEHIRSYADRIKSGKDDAGPGSSPHDKLIERLNNIGYPANTATPDPQIEQRAKRARALIERIDQALTGDADILKLPRSGEDFSGLAMPGEDISQLIAEFVADVDEAKKRLTVTGIPKPVVSDGYKLVALKTREDGREFDRISNKPAAEKVGYKYFGPRRNDAVSIFDLHNLLTANTHRRDYQFRCYRNNYAITVYEAGADQASATPLLQIPDWYAREISVTAVVRHFGKLIFAAFFVCLVYYASGTSMIFPYVKNGTWIPRRIGGSWKPFVASAGHGFFVYAVWFMSFLFFFLLGKVLFHLLSGMPAFPINFCFWMTLTFALSVVLAEGLREIANRIWGVRHNGIWRAGRGFWNGFDILLDARGHLFPLLGILGTFLGLGMAIPDRGLLDILGHLNNGRTIPGDQWSELISGIGVAVFASLHGTFTTVLAQFAAGYFGKDDKDDDDEDCKKQGSEPRAVAVVVSGPPAPPAGPAADGHPNPQQVLDALTGIDTRLTVLAHDVQKIGDSTERLAAQLAPFAATLKDVPRFRKWLRGVLPVLRRDLRTLVAREPDFTAIKAELEQIFSRLNSGPLSLLESMDLKLSGKTDEARGLIAQAKKELAEQAGSLSTRANAVSASVERLNNLVKELDEGQWVSANKQALERMNELSVEFKAVAEIVERSRLSGAATAPPGARDEGMNLIMDMFGEIRDRLPKPRKKKEPKT